MEKQLTGILKSIFFQNTDNYYKVMLIEIQDSDFDFDSSEITVTGIFGEMHEGESYRFTGQIVVHPKYGEQFQATKYEHLQPTTEESLINYFASDRFKGIGKKTAEKIVEVVGLDAIDVINDNPEILLDVPHLTPKKREMIVKEIQANYGMEQIMVQLTKLGLSNNLAFQVFQDAKEQAVDELQQDPYQFIEKIRGYTFNVAEKLAIQFDFAHNHPFRLQAAIMEIITKHCYTTGDTYMIVDQLLAASQKLLGQNFAGDVTFDEIADQVVNLVKGQKLSLHDQKISLRYLAESEEIIAQNVVRLVERKAPKFNQRKFEKVLIELSEETGITYDEAQKEAIQTALQSSFFLLTGGPGTGKTTIINGIVQIYAKLHDYSLRMEDYDQASDFPIHLAAPTGRAAKRMSESTNLPAVTIHRLLGLGRDSEEVSATDVEFHSGLLIVDEFSMVDTQIAARVLEAVSGDMQVIFVGDKDQLPSVGPGQVLADLLGVEQIPQCKLTKIYRQSDDSSIVDLAYQVVRGEYQPNLLTNHADRSYFSSDAYHIEEMIQTIVTSAKKKGYSPQDIQVLAPMYKGAAGIDKLNVMMQNLFNPAKSTKPEFKYLNGVFRLGDKVLHLVNDPEENVFNGDMGVIVGLVPADEADSQMDELIIAFDQAEVTYSRNDWQKITLAYCCSVHKAQGSEFPVVILPLVSNYAKQLLKRNLLYTAITRSKEKLILLGEAETFKYCIEHDSDVRQTNLTFCFQHLLGLSDEHLVNDIPEIDSKESDYYLTEELIRTEAIPVSIGLEGLTPYDFLEDKENDED